MSELFSAEPLARHTTIGTGGDAQWFARPATLTDLQCLLHEAAVEGLEVNVIGNGSNVLAADDGVPGLVLHLEGELAAVDIDGTTLRAGGGAANAVCLHAARSASLTGLEFACAIPGTAGAGVRMNAGAYGSDWAAIMTRAHVVTGQGSDWLTAAQLELSYRHSNLERGSVVAEVEFELAPADSETIRERIKTLVAQRKSTQPTTKRTFGSVFKNPAEGLGSGALLERCGLKGYTVGGACISPMHANFIENTGEATTADCLALMREARRRAFEEAGVELEHEVVFLGGLTLDG